MFGLKPPLYYLPGKAPSDAPALRTPSPPTPGPPRGVPPNPGTPLCPPQPAAAEGDLGVKLLSSSTLQRFWGRGKRGRGASREPWHGSAVFWGAWIPLSSAAATPSPWGFLPVPEEPGALWPRRDGQKCGMRCVLGCGSPLAAPSLPGHGDLGHQSFLCHPRPQLRPPRQRRGRGGSPRGDLGSSGGAGAGAGGVRPGFVLRVSVLGGLWGAQGWELGVPWGCSWGAASGWEPRP